VAWDRYGYEEKRDIPTAVPLHNSDAVDSQRVAKIADANLFVRGIHVAVVVAIRETGKGDRKRVRTILKQF
jgi:hypothetical protein